MLAYKKEQVNGKYEEIRVINEDTGHFKSYLVDKKYGFSFGTPQETTVQQMGYKNVKDCIKQLKSRKMLGSKVNYKDQRESERIGLINIGVERIKIAGEINIRHFEDVISKLSMYGMNYCDAQNCIIGAYLYEVE